MFPSTDSPKNAVDMFPRTDTLKWHSFYPLKPALGFILALAGGAMLFVISDEIIPETHSNGYEREATYGVVFGFILMMFLDTLI